MGMVCCMIVRRVSTQGQHLVLNPTANPLPIAIFLNPPRVSKDTHDTTGIEVAVTFVPIVVNICSCGSEFNIFS